ncbi:xyloglucan endotransglucosylase/hydrolase [Striga asiatica]|uniref:Xyloglucan endotransglucosylase/hydrolase n=1 Tax=Striga asiatica TaxID=4170 RepID=A0A5A7Q3R1_STRAF|nr:xyloglucan endotransglucosylase/hydrolase [Striga asiatica]
MACFIVLLTVIVGAFAVHTNGQGERFDKYYAPLWGFNHLTINPAGNHVNLTMDQSSGAGFRSKLEYGSGLFRIKLKIPDKRTGGVLTSFYLTSAPDGQDPGNHFELDFEFLGTNGTVQTNVYDNDGGHREESFKLWFDPSKGFHTYMILWNSKHIVFLVDNIPIRVFKNLLGRGIPYPTRPMHIEASIWDADWAGAVDWSQAPFTAEYQDFAFWACSGDTSACASEQYFWNRREYWDLNNQQKSTMERYRRSFMTYDYCGNPSTSKPECSLNA